MRTGFLTYLCLITVPYASGQFLPVPQVSGAPFSVDEIQLENPSPNVRNVLPMKTIAVYRDSAGRTRFDVSVPPDPTGNPNLVIDDPVANVVYMIDEKNKFVRRLTFPSPRPVPSAYERPKNSSAQGMMMFPGSQNIQTNTESLGNQLIQGISAEGKRVTSASPQTLPGCEKNVSVTESWYSPELWIILLQKTSHCFGEGSTHLENIRRGEPDPRLFQIPQDYVVVEQEWNKPPAKPPLVSK
jgi:hypothetical protein